jgi:hypothetical protein
MNDDVKSHEIPESLVWETELLSVVSTVIKRSITLGNSVLVFVAVMEDDGGDSRNTGAYIEGIFECRVPVLALMNAVVVSLGELAWRLASKDTHRELSHRVHGLREVLDQSFSLSGEFTTVEELSLELSKFTLRGELSSKKEPESGLWKRLWTTWSFGRLCSHSVEVLASVSNTIEVVKLGGLVQEAWHASHATDNLAYSNFTELGIAVLFLEVIKNLLLIVNDVLHLLLKSNRELSLGSLKYQTSKVLY